MVTGAILELSCSQEAFTANCYLQSVQGDFFFCSLFPRGHYLLWWVRFSLVLGLGLWQRLWLGMMSGLGLLRVSNLYSRVRVSLGL